MVARKLYSGLIMFIVSLLALQCGTLTAQNSLGLKAGTHFSVFGPAFGRFYGERLGYTFGLNGHIKLAPNIYFNPEFNYTRKGFRLTNAIYLDERLNNSEIFIGLNYLDIPLNFGYGVSVKEEGMPEMFYLFYGGLQLNFLQSQDNRFKKSSPNQDESINITEFDGLNTTDIGANIGFGLGYKNFYFDIRYCFGFISLFKAEKDDDLVNTVGLAVSYRLIFD